MAKWKKHIVFKSGGILRYEYSKYPYIIDINIGKEQGYPGSNHVSIYNTVWGGWVLGTPKAFSNKGSVRRFVAYAKKRIDSKKVGKGVAFPV